MAFRSLASGHGSLSIALSDESQHRGGTLFMKAQ